MERKMEENVRDVDTGSEAGREEVLVGNVNKLMVTPTGYTGVSRKSHLVFDACFESGNLGRVDCISEFEFDLFIRPDTCNPRFRVWFNFTVENVQETQECMRLSQLLSECMDQNAACAIHLVTKVPSTTHHCDLYAHVGWPSLHIRRQTHWLQVIYKSLLGCITTGRDWEAHREAHSWPSVVQVRVSPG
uniref:AGBL carboxypeptidase 4 n=1 Tax=Oncorhynchus tshawytscha TaxID=74940 RepID=A0AAZ3PK88_ONCTS